MGFEVEIKAHVTDVETLSRTLDSIGTLLRRYVKVDRYFGHDPNPKKALFRLRYDGDRWLCTAKKKEIIDDMEQNRETEFEVSDGDAFSALVTDLGYTEVAYKRKEGAAWSVDDVVVEVSSLGKIGDFVELELVLPDNSAEADLRRARERLTVLLGRLNIPPSAIETRSYIQMIYEDFPVGGATAGSSF